MVSIVLASHGTFSEGILMSGTMIFGPQEDACAVTLMPDMGPDDLRAKLEEAISQLSNQEEVLFLVDLQSGTPWNQVTGLLAQEGHEKWVELAGLNLPMLISAFAARMGADTAREVAQEIVAEAHAGIVSKPEDIAEQKAPAQAPAQAEASAPAGVLKPGTVLGKGQMEVLLARVDSRLLHGQVATAWTKSLRPTRIIVVSDGVAHNEMRKTLITEAAPPGVRANVVPVAKFIEAYKDPRFGATRALLLFETPQDVLRVVEGGVPLKNINMGSMAHSEGKTMLSDAISVNQADIDCLKALRDAGCEITAQKVPADKSTNIWTLVTKAGYEA